MTRINTNVGSLNAQKTLARNNQSLQTSMTRLSTGLRINSGKDDPAGMIAAAIQQNDIASMKKAIDNTQRGSQMIATADSALGQITNLLQDIRGLVTEVGNTAVMDANQIAANQLQVDSALQAIDRISQVTKFQGQRLLDGSLDFISNAQNIPQIQNLRIDNANLGTTGQMGVAVEVAAHAERANIQTSTGAQAATARLNFAARYESAVTTDGNDAKIQIMANSNSTDLNGVTVTFNKVDMDGTAATAVYDAENNSLTVTIANGTTDNSTVGEVLALINGTGLFTATTNSTDLTDAIATIGNGTVNATYIDLTANGTGVDFNDVKVKINHQTGQGSTNPGAVYNDVAKELTITLTDEVDYANGTALTAIQTKINATGAFNATISGASTVFGNYNADQRALANTGVSGYLASAFSAATQASATVTLGAGARFNYASGKDVVIKATSLGSAADNVQVNFMTGATKGSEVATYDELGKTLNIQVATTSTITEIIAAIDATGAWKATDLGNSGTTAIGATMPAAFRTSMDSINIQSMDPGANFNNMQVKFETVSNLSAGAALAQYDKTNNVFTIKVNYSDSYSQAVTLSTIANAINAVDGFSASFTKESAAPSVSQGAGVVFGKSVDTTAVGNTGSSGGNTLLADMTLEIGAKEGLQVFTFNAGTTSKQVAAAINAVTDAIGAVAYQNYGDIAIKSDAYGSKGFISVNVISEGANGTFKRSLSAFRATGTDVDAKINGIQASSDGNKMWVNTSSLAMTIDMQPEIADNFNFTITGGGAQFQLGPDVVSNQQLRVGIQSINTARMGGVSGKLFQLGTGGTADLSTDPNLAAKIVDEAIDSVTSLRGRLGAIQGLTMDTNQKTLEDMVENMTTAVSQIQDTDFAAETANLTRAQILTQSGMAVLSIANQQPQQVLSLLPR